MAPARNPSVVIHPSPVVLWLRGERGTDTVDDLADEIAHAIAFSDGDLVIDLSEVSLMGSGTVRVLIRARDFLHGRSRSLILRSPLPGSRRLLQVCGLTELIDARVAVAATSAPIEIDIDRLLEAVARAVHGRVPALTSQ